MVVILSIELVDYDNFRAYGALDYDDAIEVTEEVLGLSHEDVGGYQRIGTNTNVRTVNFAIRDEMYNSRNVQDGMYKRARLSSQKIIVVGQPNREISEVFVRYAPFDWETNKFKRIFTRFGDIKQIEHLTIRNSDTRSRDYVGKRNGITKIKMKINRPIPSSIMIERTRIEIFYTNQVRTCFRCGGGHMAYQCHATPDEFSNRFTMEDFPPSTRPSCHYN